MSVCLFVCVLFFVFSPSVVSNSLRTHELQAAAHRAFLSFTISQSLLKLVSFESVIPSNHLVLCHPLLLLPSIFPRIRVFSNESTLCIRWPEFWSFSFSICPSFARRGTFSRAQMGFLSNTQKWIVRGDTCADKARGFIGKGDPGGEQ